MYIIGVSGKRKVGKTTVANLIAEQLGKTKKVEVIAFADMLKDVCALVFNMPRNLFDAIDLKEVKVEPCGMSPRQMMQRVADSLKKVAGERIFVESVAAKLKDAKVRGADVVVIHDVRYPYEAELVRSNSGTVIHVVRDRRPLTNDVIDMHSSEKGIDLCVNDMVIKNNYSMSRLESLVEKQLMNINV